MAVDLVSTITQFITPDTVQKIASSVGADGREVQTAIAGAVPALLAGFAGTASHGGAQKVADAVNEQKGALDNLGGLLSGGQNSLIDSGTQLVGSIVGPGAQNAIASAIAKFSGLGQGAATALVGALAPIVLGVIGKQAGPKGFDASSLSNLLASQQSNIANAMPSKMSGFLEGSGVLESLDDVADTASGAARAAASSARDAAASAGRYANSAATSAARSASEATSSGPRWLYWLVPVVLALGLLWFFTGRNQPPAVNTSPANVTSTNVTTTAPNLEIGGVNVGQVVGDNLATLRTSFEGVTDAASAQAALPRIESASTGLDQVVNVLGQATAEQKTAITGMAAPIIQAINPMIDRVMAIPGVGAILQPAVDALKTKLTALTA